MRTLSLPLWAALLVSFPAGVAAQNAPSNFFDTSSVGTLSVRNGDTPQALSIERTSVKVEIVGRMARTEVTQVFRSHLTRQSEGEYRFTLPDGASVSRLAMDVEGRMMEGELHEKKRAREIYEGIVRRMKDPALLEWEGGNRFRTRIFPIPGRGTKTVILTYEQLIDGQRAHYSYALPRLVGADHDVAFGRFEFTLTAWETGKIELVTYPEASVTSRSGVERVELRRRNFVPDGPVVVSFPQIQSAARLLTAKVDGERFFLLDHTLQVPDAAVEPRPLVFAVDTSASVGDAQLGRIKEVVRALAAAHPAPHCVVYGDLDTVTCSNDDGGACLNHVVAGGASDLSKLLSEAAGRARAYGRPATVLLFSDGTPTLGILDGHVLAARAGRGAGPPVTIHTVAVGVDNDLGALDAIAQSGGGRRDQLLPGGHRYVVGDGVDVLIVVHAGRGPTKQIAQLRTTSEMGLLAQFPLSGGGPVLRAPRPTEQLGLINKYGTRYLPTMLPTFPGPVLRTRPPCTPTITLDGAPLEAVARLDINDVAGSAWAHTRAFDVSMSLSMALNSTTAEESNKGLNEACSAHPTHCGADTRYWATLPASMAVGRASLPTGRHEVEVRGCTQSATQAVTVEGAWALVQIWVE